MDLLKIRQEMRTKSIFDIPMRVTFYARVSSDKDAQLNSLDNQISYYADFIQKNTAWVYVPGYVDEGITGMMTTKREDFHRMIEDASAGAFDLIITKEISRFARNTLDSIQYTRQLLTYGVGVFFQNDAINTLDDDAELRLTIMAAIAQDEVRKLSSRIKFGHQQAIKKGVVLGNGKMWGYNQKDGKLTINPKEAEMVKMLFELYASGEYSLKQLETVLADAGYLNGKGKPIAHGTLSRIITNPKYKGYYVGNKVRIIDMFTKKQKFLDQSEWVVVKDETGETVPAIVSETLWAQANEVHERRSLDVKKRQNIHNHGNLLTGKIFCAHCGVAYYRKDSVDPKGNHNSRWVCSNKLKHGAKSCPSVSLFESELVPILVEIFTEATGDIDRLLNQYMDYYKSLSAEKNIPVAMEKINTQMARIKQKKRKLLEFNVDGVISDAEYAEQNNELTAELESLEAELAELSQREKLQGDFEGKFRAMRATFERAKEIASTGSITPEFVQQYVERIDAAPVDGVMQLDIKLTTNQSMRKYVTRVGRSGAMFKKMIEAQERAMSGQGSGTMIR